MMQLLSPHKQKIYLQIEHQERELDAKVLFSMFAAERGYEAVLGYKGALRKIHIDLPSGAWIHHNARGRGKPLEYFWYRRLGFRVIVLDEEALVRQTDNLFLRKHAPGVFRHIDRVFAWGESDLNFWLRSEMVSADKLAVTGNPRVDLLRPELQSYYGQRISEIRNGVGKYVLVNTNFPTVNHAMGKFNKFNISDRRDYAVTKREIDGFLAHKRNIFDGFLDLIPDLAAAVHPHTLVIRPHPSEDRSVWDERAKGIDNVRVVLEGSVAPWILGAAALIHNNCTTAVEAALLKRPVATYMPVTSDQFDNDFCNSMGAKCHDKQQLASFVRRILTGEHPEQVTREKIMAHHINTDDGKFACEYMLDEIGKFLETAECSRRAGRLEISVRNAIAGTAKLLKNDQEKKEARSKYMRRKISDIGHRAILSRMEQFKTCLDRFHDVDCIDIGRDVFAVRK